MIEIHTDRTLKWMWAAAKAEKYDFFLGRFPLFDRSDLANDAFDYCDSAVGPRNPSICDPQVVMWIESHRSRTVTILVTERDPGAGVPLCLRAFPWNSELYCSWPTHNPCGFALVLAAAICIEKANVAMVASANAPILVT